MCNIYVKMNFVYSFINKKVNIYKYYSVQFFFFTNIYELLYVKNIIYISKKY